MYIRFRRTVHPIEFLKKHAKPHIIVGHYDPLDHRDENGIGPVTYRIALGIVMNTLDLAGECTDMVDPEACTLNLMFERADDAAKVCRLVQATPAKALADSASRAEFVFDQAVFERLRPLRDARMAAIRAAYERDEPVEFVPRTVSPEEPEPGPIADDWGNRGPLRVMHRFPLDDAGR